MFSLSADFFFSLICFSFFCPWRALKLPEENLGVVWWDFRKRRAQVKPCCKPKYPRRYQKIKINKKQKEKKKAKTTTKKFKGDVVEKCTVRVRKGKRSDFFFFFFGLVFSPCLAHIKLVSSLNSIRREMEDRFSLKGEDVSARALLLCLSIRWSIILKVEEKSSAADGLQLASGPAHCLHQPLTEGGPVLCCAVHHHHHQNFLPYFSFTPPSVFLLLLSCLVSFISTWTPQPLYVHFIASFF